MYYEEKTLRYQTRTELVEQLNNLRAKGYRLRWIEENRIDGWYMSWGLFEVMN